MSTANKIKVEGYKWVLEENQQVFHNGRQYRLVGMRSEHKGELHHGIGTSVIAFAPRMFFALLMDPSDTWTVKEVPLCETEPLVTDVFKLGDKVQSKYTFRGRVVGYELSTNSVIAVSEKVAMYTDRNEPGDGSRVRYSYKLDDIMPLKPEIEFELNKRYRLVLLSGEVIDVRALEGVAMGSRRLYRLDNGKFVCNVSLKQDPDMIHTAYGRISGVMAL
ncbi:hypothetical protein D3C71_765610 [compost metagenome]